MYGQHHSIFILCVTTSLAFEKMRSLVTDGKQPICGLMPVSDVSVVVSADTSTSTDTDVYTVDLPSWYCGREGMSMFIKVTTQCIMLVTTPPCRATLAGCS